MATCELTLMDTVSCAHCRPATDPAGRVRALALELMREHGLLSQGWKMTWGRATTHAGRCIYAPRTIELSKPWAETRTLEESRQTILHEIAHALVGAAHRHDAVWLRKARELGYTGNATTSAAHHTPPTAWHGTCPTCKKVYGRTQKPTTVKVCGHHGRRVALDTILVWTKDGSTVPMPSSYTLQLARVKARYGLAA